MKDQIDLAAELGAMVPIGVLRGSESGADRLKWLAESLFELYEHTQKSGGKLIIEPVNRYETRLINSVTDALEFLDTFDLPEFELIQNENFGTKLNWKIHTYNCKAWGNENSYTIENMLEFTNADLIFRQRKNYLKIKEHTVDSYYESI